MTSRANMPLLWVLFWPPFMRLVMRRITSHSFGLVETFAFVLENQGRGMLRIRLVFAILLLAVLIAVAFTNKAFIEIGLLTFLSDSEACLGIKFSLMRIYLVIQTLYLSSTYTRFRLFFIETSVCILDDVFQVTKRHGNSNSSSLQGNVHKLCRGWSPVFTVQNMIGMVILEKRLYVWWSSSRSDELLPQATTDV